jgi:hypothetical protein
VFKKAAANYHCATTSLLYKFECGPKKLGREGKCYNLYIKLEHPNCTCIVFEVLTFLQHGYWRETNTISHITLYVYMVMIASVLRMACSAMPRSEGVEGV